MVLESQVEAVATKGLWHLKQDILLRIICKMM